jgi:DNA polymerase III alpha subunit
MTSDRYGQLVYCVDDLIDLIMSGHTVDNLLVDDTVDINDDVKELLPNLKKYAAPQLTVEEFDQLSQSNWFMPEEYQQLDIAAYVLGLCDNAEQLQRCGQELLLYQERGMFPVLCYVKYLVDVMRTNNLIWGVGRGSSVASYVLYKLGLHRIDSMYYDLDPQDFLR